MRKILFITAFSTAFLFTAQAAAEVHWLPASDNDLTPAVLAGAERAPAAAGINHAREAVSFAWPLDAGGQPAALEGLAGHTASSRQYWLDVTAAELARGVELPTSAPGALIRVSVLEQSKTPDLAPENLQIQMNGHALETRQAVEFSVTGGDLQDARMPVPDNTLAFRLDEDTGTGNLHLTLANKLPAGTPVVIHVFEPDSEIVARLTTPRLHYLAGETLELQLVIDGVVDGTKRQLTPATTQAVLTSPDLDTRIPLGINRGTLTARLPATITSRPGELWEARVYLETEVDGRKVMRDVQVAFNVALPVARLNGEATQTGSTGVEMAVEVAQPGRFQLSGVLYGTNRNGDAQPVAMAQSAAWLNPGQHHLLLDFDGVTLDQMDVNAPWEIRDLRLTDQGRMALMQRVEGIRLTD